MNCRAPKIVAGLLLIASADFAIAQQDRFPQPTSSRLSERNLPPGRSWLEIMKRPTLEAFAAICVDSYHAPVASGWSGCRVGFG